LTLKRIFRVISAPIDVCFLRTNEDENKKHNLIEDKEQNADVDDKQDQTDSEVSVNDDVTVEVSNFECINKEENIENEETLMFHGQMYKNLYGLAHILRPICRQTLLSKLCRQTRS
jgi:uncharacterized membrane protein